MDILRKQIRTGAAIAAIAAGLMLSVTPAYAVPSDNEIDVDACGGGRSILGSYEPANDVNEGESS